MLHAYDQRFDMKGNLENFCELNKRAPGQGGKVTLTHSCCHAADVAQLAQAHQPGRAADAACTHGASARLWLWARWTDHGGTPIALPRRRHLRLHVRRAARAGGHRPGIVAVMASAEAGEDTSLPAAGCRRALWPWPTQPRSSAPAPAWWCYAPVLCLLLRSACLPCPDPGARVGRRRDTSSRPASARWPNFTAPLHHPSGPAPARLCRCAGAGPNSDHKTHRTSGQVHSTTELNVLTTLLSLVAHEQVEFLQDS